MPWIGDFSGDGRDDLVMSAIGADKDRGKVYLIYQENLITGFANIEDVTVDIEIKGDDNNDEMGYALVAGNLAGEAGQLDLVVGAWLADGEDNDDRQSGEVHIYFDDIVHNSEDYKPSETSSYDYTHLLRLPVFFLRI